MKALIFAAGLGTRLRPITLSKPKALVEVGGVPMLERVIRSVRKAGINEMVVNAWAFSEQIVDFVSKAGNLPEMEDLDIKVSVEPGSEPFETGGGIRYARPLLKGCGRFLVHNADILSNLDIRSFVESDAAICRESGRSGANGRSPLATLLVTDAPAERKLLFDDGMRLVGWTNLRTGEVKSPYPDFRPEMYRQYSFCGIHIISEDIFALMEGWPEKFGITDFYLKACKDSEIRGTVSPKGFKMIDIGTPEALNEANKLVSSQFTYNK